MKVRPNVGALLAAGPAHEARFQIGEPDLIGPWVCADRGRVAAVMVRAIDQETAHAGGAHLAERDLLRPGHARIEAPPPGRGNTVLTRVPQSSLRKSVPFLAAVRMYLMAHPAAQLRPAITTQTWAISIVSAMLATSAKLRRRIKSPQDLRS
jgi:hypothetical protein